VLRSKLFPESVKDIPLHPYHAAAGSPNAEMHTAFHSRALPPNPTEKPANITVAQLEEPVKRQYEHGSATADVKDAIGRPFDAVQAHLRRGGWSACILNLI